MATYTCKWRPHTNSNVGIPKWEGSPLGRHLVAMATEEPMIGRHLRSPWRPRRTSGDHVGIPAQEFQCWHSRGVFLSFHTHFIPQLFTPINTSLFFLFQTTLDNQETSFLHHSFSLHFLSYLNLTSRLPPLIIPFLPIFSTNLLSHFPFDFTYLDTSSSSTLYTKSIKGKERIKFTKGGPWVIS